MKRLADHDLRDLMDFVRESYALRDLDAFVAWVLDRLPRLVPCGMIGYHEIDPARRHSRDLLRPEEFSTPTSRAVWPTVMHEHAVLRYNLATADHRAYKISDFESRARFQSRALYTDLYRGMDVEDIFCFALPRTDDWTIVGFSMGRDRRSFGERDRLVLNLLRPHLGQALVNARRVDRIRREFALLERVAEQSDQALVFVDARGRIDEANARARQWLQDYGAECVGDTLPDSLWRWIRAQRAALAGAAVTAPPQPLVLELPQRRLVIRLATDGACTMLLMQEERADTAREALLERGLTPREAEVLSWVTEGKTNAEIGTLLSISPRTVQKHLEHVFEKLGTETRTAAAIAAFHRSC